MASSTFSSSTYTDLVELGRRLYDRSLIRREDEHITDPRGQAIGWLLDTRIAMLDGPTFKEVGGVMAERLRARDITQVAGYGFGAYSMVCSVLAAPDEPSLPGWLYPRAAQAARTPAPGGRPAGPLAAGGSARRHP